MKQWHFYEPVFRRWVVLQISSFEDFKHEMKLCGLDDWEILQNAKGMCIDMQENNNAAGQCCTFIWLAAFESATLIHEIAHMVMMNFDNLGIPISRDNTEAFSFYTEYWYSQIIKVRRKYPNGRTPSQARKIA